MRKIIFLMSLLICSAGANSQSFFDGGIKGFYGTTWLMNQNIFKRNSDYKYQVSSGFSIGTKLGYNFNESVELVTEFYYSGFKQNFSITEDGEKWKKTIRMNSYDIPLLIRHNTGSGGYFEIGPQYTMIRKVSENMQDMVIADAAAYFDKTYLSAVLGFGNYIVGWGNVGISWGFKIVYSFADIVDGVVPNGYYTHKTATDADYAKTNPLSAGISLEFNYDLGYMAKSPCTGRREFLLFK